MAQERTGKVERDLQTDQDRTDKVERDLQQAKNEVERLTLERDFYSDKASALEEENRQLTESATKYSLHAQELERELTEVATKYCGAPSQRRPTSTRCCLKNLSSATSKKLPSTKM